MRKCPICKSSKYKITKQGWICFKCGYRNDPQYLKKLKNETQKKLIK